MGDTTSMGSWTTPDDVTTWIDGDGGMLAQTGLSNTPPKSDDDENNGDGDNS